MAKSPIYVKLTGSFSVILCSQHYELFATGSLESLKLAPVYWFAEVKMSLLKSYRGFKFLSNPTSQLFVFFICYFFAGAVLFQSIGALRSLLVYFDPTVKGRFEHNNSAI